MRSRQASLYRLGWGWALAVVGLLLLAALAMARATESAGGVVARSASAPAHEFRGSQEPARSGTLRLLSYNVAGLHEWISPVASASTAPLIGPLLNHYDLVLLQEDFAYHQSMVAAARHAFELPASPGRFRVYGDGLTVLSHWALVEPQRSTWERCNGVLLDFSDCLAAKGFGGVRVVLDRGVVLQLINVHADAGRSAADVAARAEEFAQLTQFIAEVDPALPVVVAGDTNLEESSAEDVAILRHFLRETRLREVSQRPHATGAGVDRVFVRDGSQVALNLASVNEDARFVGGEGIPLSDHPALAVHLRWQAHARVRTAQWSSPVLGRNLAANALE